MGDRDDHLLPDDHADARGIANPFQGINIEHFDSDNFHTLSNHFPQLNSSIGGFSQHSLHALSQHALGQQALHQRSISLPQRLSPQTGLYDTNPGSLLDALRAHGHPKQLVHLSQHLPLHQQQQQHHHHHHQQQQAALAQPVHAALHHARLESLQHDLAERDASDGSPSVSLQADTTLSLEADRLVCTDKEVKTASAPSRSRQMMAASADLSAVAAATAAAIGRLPASPAPPLHNQAAAGAEPPSQHHFSHATLEDLRAATEKFAADREWEKFHAPRNLLLALVAEVGELTEIFQWRGDGVARGLPGFTSDEKRQVGEEMSDVLLYLIRMADVCGIDLAAAVQRKMQANADKYPSELCRGSSAKYTTYTRGSDPLDEANGNKRKRFTDEQLSALTDLAEEANWSLLSVAKEAREQFCTKHEISKERLHNFFNNRKPKDLKKRKLGPNNSDTPTLKSETSLDLDQQQTLLQGQGSSAVPAPSLQ